MRGAARGEGEISSLIERNRWPAARGAPRGAGVRIRGSAH